MRYEWRIALRHLRARRRQVLVSVVTLISVAGVAVGVIALVIALSLMNGFQQEVRARILGATPHMHVFRRGVMIADPDAAARRIEAIGGIVASSPILQEKGLLTSADRSEGVAVVVKAVDPLRYERVTDLSSRVVEGSLAGLALQEGVLLGADLAAELGVRRGGEVRLWTTRLHLRPFGAPLPRTYTLRVAGTFRTGFYEFDSGWAFLSLREADRLFGAGGMAGAIEVRTRDLGEVGRYRAAVEASLGPGWAVLDWRDLNRPLFHAFKLEKLLISLVIGLIVLVAALNIVTTLVLTVMEKTRDIGILRAMGANPRSILTVFMAQGIVIGVLGTAIGTAIGVAAARWLDAAKVFRLDEQVYFIPYVPFRVGAWDIVIVDVLALLVSFLATLYPAWKAARLDPVEALRYE